MQRNSKLVKAFGSRVMRDGEHWALRRLGLEVIRLAVRDLARQRPGPGATTAASHQEAVRSAAEFFCEEGSDLECWMRIMGHPEPAAAAAKVRDGARRFASGELDAFWGAKRPKDAADPLPGLLAMMEIEAGKASQ